MEPLQREAEATGGKALDGEAGSSRSRARERPRRTRAKSAAMSDA